MLVSTRPLGPTDCWEEVPMNTLQVYEKGKLIYTGHDHGNEFVDSEEKMRLIFMDYSLL
jgi:glutamine amidotransferase